MPCGDLKFLSIVMHVFYFILSSHIITGSKNSSIINIWLGPNIHLARTKYSYSLPKGVHLQDVSIKKCSAVIQ
jgi:hypothetical protein